MALRRSPRTVLLVSNIRMGPFESADSYGHLTQRFSWLIQPMSVIAEHLQALADYPPVQGGASFNMSNSVDS